MVVHSPRSGTLLAFVMTMSSLQLLFEAIERAEDEEELRSHVVPKIGEHFAAKRQGVFFFDQLPLKDKKLQRVFETALTVEHNPVVRYLTERHAPVHNSMVTSPKVWRMVCPRADHRYVMAGPIVSKGKIVGAVGCTREQAKSPFCESDLADMSAICLHLSVWAASVRPGRLTLKSNRLTSRELQIAELVALGRTNAEIGNELWIAENSVKQALKRMFRKLEVSSRTEMTAQLCTRHPVQSN